MSTTNTVALELHVPSQLYDKLLQLAENTGRESPSVVALRMLERALEEEPSVIPPTDPFDFEKHFGMGRDLFVDDEDFEAYLKATEGPSYMDVARLARPDGETRAVSFRMTPEMAAWLEERRAVLLMIDELQAFYNTIDGATAARHMLAQEIVAQKTLVTPPEGGGEPTAVKLPRDLYAKLEARIPEVIAAGARSNAGVGTVIRWVFAQMMARAKERERRLSEAHG